MILEREMFVIATKELPIRFDDGNGDLVNKIDDACLNYEKSMAESDLDLFDEPENFQILTVKVTYEF